MLKYVLNALLAVFCANVLFGADAKWIAADDSTVDAPNAWVAFRKDVNLDEVPSGTTAVVYMPEFTKGKKISVNGDSDLSKFAAKKFKHPSKATLSLPAGEYKITAQ